MDSNSGEQTELLRNIWNQMKDMDRNLSGRIDRVAEEVAGVKQEVAGVKQEVAGLKLEMQEVKGEIAGLKLEMREVKGEISELRNDLHQTNLDIRAVKVATQLTVDLLVKADARQESDLADVRERVARIEQHIGFPR